MTFKKRLLFTLLMCTGMASSMSWLGMATKMGINRGMWRIFGLALLPTIGFAFVFNFVVVGTLTQLLIKWRTRNMVNQTAILLKANAMRGWTMLLVMCLTMSTRALMMNGTLFHMTITQFILGFFGTLTTAYFVRNIFIMPLVRKILAQVMPD